MARKSSRPSRTAGQASDKQPIAPTDYHPTTAADKQPTGPAADQPTGASAAQPCDSPITQTQDVSNTQATSGSERQPTNVDQAVGLAGRAEAEAQPMPAAGQLAAGSVKSRCSDRGHRREKAAHTPAAKRKGVPLTPLAERMLHDLQLAGMSARTQESYLRAVRKFAQFCRLAPDKTSENHLRRYLLSIKNEQHWEANSLKVAYSGLKFFYKTTCPRDWATLKNLRVPKSDKLPSMLSIPEVDQSMAAVRKPLMRCFLWTVYALGQLRRENHEPGPCLLDRLVN